LLTLSNGLRALLVSDRDEPFSDDLSSSSDLDSDGNPYDDAMDTSDSDGPSDRGRRQRGGRDDTDSEDSEQSPMQVI